MSDRTDGPSIESTPRQADRSRGGSYRRASEWPAVRECPLWPGGSPEVVPLSTGRIYDRNRFMGHRNGTHSTNREESIYDCEHRDGAHRNTARKEPHRRVGWGPTWSISGAPGAPFFRGVEPEDARACHTHVKSALFIEWEHGRGGMARSGRLCARAHSPRNRFRGGAWPRLCRNA